MIKFIINGQTYLPYSTSNNDRELQIEIVSNMSFAVAYETLNVDDGGEITQMNDEDEIVGVYYAYGICSLNSRQENPRDRIITVKYNVTKIGIDSQQVIEEDVSNAEDALLEIAEFYADMQESLQTNTKKLEAQERDTNTAINNIHEIMNRHTSSISNLESIFAQLSDRVAELENRLNGG